MAVAVAVEFEEQGRGHRITGLRVAVDRVHLDLVEQLDPGHRDPELNRGDDRFDRAVDGIERADGGRHRFRQRVQPHGDVGDDAERPLRSDKQSREIVARRRFARAGPGPNYAAIGEHDRQGEHVVAHRAVADRGGA